MRFFVVSDCDFDVCRTLRPCGVDTSLQVCDLVMRYHTELTEKDL